MSSPFFFDGNLLNCIYEQKKKKERKGSIFANPARIWEKCVISSLHHILGTWIQSITCRIHWLLQSMLNNWFFCLWIIGCIYMHILTYWNTLLKSIPYPQQGCKQTVLSICWRRWSGTMAGSLEGGGEGKGEGEREGSVLSNFWLSWITHQPFSYFRGIFKALKSS